MLAAITYPHLSSCMRNVHAVSGLPDLSITVDNNEQNVDIL